MLMLQGMVLNWYNTSCKTINLQWPSHHSRLGEYYQSSVYSGALSIVQPASINNGIYETLATITYPQTCTNAE